MKLSFARTSLLAFLTAVTIVECSLLSSSPTLNPTTGAYLNGTLPTFQVFAKEKIKEKIAAKVKEKAMEKIQALKAKVSGSAIASAGAPIGGTGTTAAITPSTMPSLATQGKKESGLAALKNKIDSLKSKASTTAATTSTGGTAGLTARKIIQYNTIRMIRKRVANSKSVNTN